MKKTIILLPLLAAAHISTTHAKITSWEKIKTATRQAKTSAISWIKNKINTVASQVVQVTAQTAIEPSLIELEATPVAPQPKIASQEEALRLQELVTTAPHALALAAEQVKHLKKMRDEGENMETIITLLAADVMAPLLEYRNAFQTYQIPIKPFVDDNFLELIRQLILRGDFDENTAKLAIDEALKNIS